MKEIENEGSLEILKSLIEQYDQIFFVDFLPLFSYFCCSQSIYESSRKILILSVFKPSDLFWAENLTCRQMPHREADMFLQLYLLYEFSDKIGIVSEKSICYGSIFNLVKTGQLSLEEVLAALLV